VWLVSASAADSGAASGTAPAAATGTATSATGGPTVTLQGCARDQSQVAVTLVRLRELQGATDVSLTHSTRGADGSDSGSAPAAPATGGGSADNSCGATGGKPNYAFEASVTFTPLTGDSPDKVPNRLGGGA
jgi:hypothetical protein